jgi:hypothetical protein
MDQQTERLEALKAEVRADPELGRRVRALSNEAKQLWAIRCRQRLAQGEPLDGIGWRALVDVRWEYPPPDGWRGLFPRTRSSPDALPPGWPADVAPPDNLAALLAIEQITVLAARPDACPECGFSVALLWQGPHDQPPLWSCPICSATVAYDIPQPCHCGSFAFRDTPLHHGQSVRRDCAVCGRFHSFPVWYGHRPNAQERERLRELLLTEARQRGWPAVRLAPRCTLPAGKDAWERYLNHPSHGLPEYQRLLQALERSERP